MTPPAIAFSGGAPYDTVQSAINAARAHLNDKLDTLAGVSGKLLGTPTNFSQQITNNAWRRMQNYLGNKGYSRFTNEVICTALPLAGSQDPAIQCSLSWGGFNDGVTQWTEPALPPDFVAPLAMWERFSGQNMPFPDAPMEKILNTLQSWPRGTCMGRWLWRSDEIILPGSLQLEDLKILYIRFVGDFLDTDAKGVPVVAGNPPALPIIRWYNQPLPVMRSDQALGWLIASETEIARKNEWAEEFNTRAESAMNEIFNRDVRANQRVNLRRQSRSGRLETNNSYQAY